MDADTLEAVKRIARIAGWLGTAILASIILAFLLPRISHLLHELRRALVGLRGRVRSAAVEYVLPGIENWWRDRRTEPRRPVIAELERATAAIGNIGTAQLVRFEAAETRFRRHVDALVAAGRLGVDQSALTAAREAAHRPSVLGALSLLVLSVIGTLIVGAVNALLLGIFFRELLGNIRLLPYPLPDIQVGHVAAVLFFAIEVGLGLLLPQRRRSRPASGTSDARVTTRDSGDAGMLPEVVFHQYVPWGGIVVLSLIEAFAYATLSKRMDLPAQLGLTPDSAFYDVAKYFMAGFGVILTLLLAALGHVMSGRFDDLRQALADRAARRAVDRLQKQVQSAGASGDVLAKTVAEVRQNLIASPIEVAANFRDAVGLPNGHSVLAESVRSSIVEPLRTMDTQAAEPTVNLRTRSQVMADLLMSCVGLVFLAVVLALTWMQVSDYIQAVQPDRGVVLAWSVAAVASGAAVALAVWVRSALGHAQHTSLPSFAINSALARHAMARALLIGLGAAALLYILLELRLRPFGRAILLNASVGLVQAAALIGLGSLLDQLVLGAWHAAIAIGLVGVRLVAVAAAAALFVCEGMCYIGLWILRLLAIPGDAILAAVSRRPRLVLPPGIAS
jgi:hypothetical protein